MKYFMMLDEREFSPYLDSIERFWNIASAKSRFGYKMTIYPIIVAPDPRLKIKGKPVEKVDDEIRQLMDDMLETMYAAHGIGLAAAQIGVDKRIIVVDVAQLLQR